MCKPHNKRNMFVMFPLWDAVDIENRKITHAEQE
jgi:hypothetical protein